jgi:hypothetical protein
MSPFILSPERTEVFSARFKIEDSYNDPPALGEETSSIALRTKGLNLIPTKEELALCRIEVGSIVSSLIDKEL